MLMIDLDSNAGGDVGDELFPAGLALSLVMLVLEAGNIIVY